MCFTVGEPTMTFQRLLALLMLPFAITGFSLGQSQTRPAISVEQRIDAATRFVGYFQRTHTPEDLESVINTISEVNSNRESGAPLEPYGETRERQIKNTLSTWFLIFRTIDSVSTNVPAGNRCYFNLAPPGGFIGMDPKEVTGAAERENYERQLADNDARCELQNFQLLELPRLDVDAQLAFRQALRGLIAAEGVGLGSDFAVALATSDLNGARSRLMWAIFDHATDADWQPAALSTSRHVSPSFSETADSKNADKHTAEWLRSSEPRSVAWAAYYSVRDDRKNSIPELLAYIHRHAYDPLFEANVNRRMTLGPEVDDALDAMRAVLVALIKLRATVPSEDLLQLAAVLPDEALILASSPVPQESMLMNAYMSGGFKPRAYGEFYSLAGAQPADSADALRWTVAGNLLANRGSAKFARIIFDRFVLRLDFTVADKSTLFMGGGPIQFPSFEGRERGADWPPLGTTALVPNHHN